MSYRDEAVGWTQNTPQLQLSWRKLLERGRSGFLCLGCSPHNLALDKRKKNDGWHYNQLL